MECPLKDMCPFYKIHLLREWYGVRTIPCFDEEYLTCEIYKKCGKLGKDEEKKKCLEDEWKRTEFLISLITA